MSTTWYVIDIPTNDEQDLLQDGFCFDWTPPATNASPRIRLRFRECLGTHRLTYPNGVPIPAGALDPDGGAIEICWSPECECFTTPEPAPPAPESELVWPDGGVITATAGYDLNGELGPPEAYIELVSNSDGTTTVELTNGSSDPPGGDFQTFNGPAWRSPAVLPVGNYEVRVRVTSDPSAVTVVNSGDLSLDTWTAMDPSRVLQVGLGGTDAVSVTLVWEFRDAGNDATIRVVTINITVSANGAPAYSLATS